MIAFTLKDTEFERELQYILLLKVLIVKKGCFYCKERCHKSTFRALVLRLSAAVKNHLRQLRKIEQRRRFLCGDFSIASTAAGQR